MNSVLHTSLEYLTGVGPTKGALLQKELRLFTFSDLLHYYPFRYEDRSQTCTIGSLDVNMPSVQLRGTIVHINVVEKGKKRLVVRLKDATGEVSLVWFKGLQWVGKKLQAGVEYVVFGKPTLFGDQFNMVHPEIEVATVANTSLQGLRPVYGSTEKLKARYLHSKGIEKLQTNLWKVVVDKVPETLPSSLLSRYDLVSRKTALQHVHFPTNVALLNRSLFRLKFEELFFIQLQLFQRKQIRTDKHPGRVLHSVEFLKRFYHEHLSFHLTNAQQRVVREVYHDVRSGHQMNRLVQGDVGSGKTMVAFLSILLCIGSGAQASMMAPTEILAEQHYNGLKSFSEAMGVSIALLTGSTPRKQRKDIIERLRSGELQLVVGTHALLNEEVQFRELGLVIIDEQHRFGVAQRAKLWTKSEGYFPHVLVMTATPIPRTLAMTLYGDLDISVIDELPAGRRPIQTSHFYDKQRLRAFGLLNKQILAGRQAYVVYPLIEESENLDYKNLMDGYESVCRAFPDFPISVVHGKMAAVDKEYEMQRFVRGDTKIMVATTVIEVGVNVPNATVMVIENAERFGLAQLHQLRGRVGRGSEQSYCFLMTGEKLSGNSRERIGTMVRTNDGFEIADVDLQLRGPGNLLGIQQSGVLDLKIADLSKDNKILQIAREAAQQLLERDPDIKEGENLPIKMALQHQNGALVNWGDVS